MEFKVGERLPKATLVIGDKTYKFYAPTNGQRQNFNKEIQENKSNISAVDEIMMDLAAEISDCPKEVLMGLDSEFFDRLLTHVLSIQKKS